MNRVSKLRAKQLRIYAIQVKAWKIGKVCIVCGKVPIDCHHSFGKIHILLLVAELWKPVCRSCHERIKNEPNWARQLGLLAPVGQWNSCPKELAQKYEHYRYL